MSQPEVHIIPALEDNYGYVITSNGGAVVIDPSDDRTFIQWLNERSLTASHILLTHYHHDHIGGVEAIRKKHDALVIGPGPCAIQINQRVGPGSRLLLHDIGYEVIDTPGHAFPHVSYYVRDQGWLFSGDCLFGAGCGRLAGNAAATMWKSLALLADLPNETRVYCGHEYTLSNLAFAASLEPGNDDIATRRLRVSSAMTTGSYSVPFTIAEEKLTNPFLRVNSPEIRGCMNLQHALDVEVFAALRAAKNVFRE